MSLTWVHEYPLSYMKEDSYEYRRGLSFVGQTPKFIQQIKKGTEDAKIQRAQNRQTTRPVYGEEEPVLVDSEGNALPEEALESDRKLDSLFSLADEENLVYGASDGQADDFKDDSDMIDGFLQRETRATDDRISESARKKARMGAIVKIESSKQLSKLKSDPRLLSFEDEDF